MEVDDAIYPSTWVDIQVSTPLTYGMKFII